MGAFSCFQDSGVGSVPRHCQTFGDSGDRQMLTDQTNQRPTHSAARAWSRCGGGGSVLSPHMPRTGAFVAADGDLQRRESPPVRFVRQPPHNGVPGCSSGDALVAPVIRFHNSTGQDCSVRRDLLPGHRQPEPVQAAERGQVRAAEYMVRHVEDFQMGSVREP